MSHNYSYRTPPDGFRLHQHMYSDSCQAESNIYGPRTKSAPQEPMHSTASSNRTLDSSVHMPGKALSFLHSCGLEQSDLTLYAKLPEHLITGETLPKLLFQIKERKASSTPSSRSSTTPPRTDTLSHAWEGSSHVSAVEYPLHRPERPIYPLPPEQVQSWQDRWGNPRRTGSATNTSTGCKTSNILDYGHSSIEDPYYKQTYISAAPETSSTVSQSYGDYSRAPRHNLEPLHPVSLDPFLKVPTRKEASDFLGRVPPVFPYACILCDITVLSEKDWSVHIRGAQHANSQLELVEKYPQWDQQIESARRSECQVTPQPKYSETKDLNRELFRQETKAKIKTTPENDKDWSVHIKGSHNANSQHELRAKYHKWDHHHPIEPSKRVECQVIPQPKATETRVPTRKEASDFHGIIPQAFPYACVLCNITVLSENDWSLHIRGAQHANTQLELLEKYPDWDQHIESAKRSECQKTLPTTSTETRGGAKKDNNSKTIKRPNMKAADMKDKGKVVCIKFVVNSVKEEYLKKLLGQFGAIVKVIMFPTLAFVEMESKDQTEDIVKYFNNNPLEVEGKRVEFSVSGTFTFLQSSRVVSFSPLPAGDGISSELKAIAKRFGSIKNSLFLPSRGYIEMSNPEDAHKLIQQYSANPLKLKRKIIQVTFSSEYENLNMWSRDQQADDRTLRSRKRSGSEIHSSQSDSPSPKRKHSAERADSSRTCSSTEEDDNHESRERSRSSSRRSSVCSQSPAKDSLSELCEYAEVKTSASNDEAAIMDSDSDLEGVEVIADDGVELQHDFDFDGDEPKTEHAPEDNQKMDQEQNTCEEASQQEDQASSTTVMDEQGTSAGVEEVKYSNIQQQENFPSDTMDVPSIHSNVQVETLEGALNDPLKTSNSLKIQIHKEQKGQDVKIEEEDSDLEETLENCITLDQLVEEISSHYQESDELKPSTQETEQPFGKVLDIRNLPTKNYTDLDFVNIAKRYGEVKHYLLFHSCKKGLIEMVHASDADRIAADSKNQDIALRGNILKIKVSEKYGSLPTTRLSAHSDSDEEQGSKGAKSKASSNNHNGASNRKSVCSSDAADGLMAELSNELQNRREPVGTEYVRSVVGYFCDLCSVIYASEEEAKNEHCRSPSHNAKLKEHMENSGSA
ncbi:matrin 3-like 1.1 isoform X1 [Electrophorus electricus]|uniref:matrin 3-like 1.1 isoform X1 n=1 Tax=Electrophorus electricus TaxID=8005 RepID=UPI0015D02F8D|nr:matrin 3-like 1.1 isoform X1 [Electrophorus electricus]